MREGSKEVNPFVWCFIIDLTFFHKIVSSSPPMAAEQAEVTQKTVGLHNSS